jgi:4-diphosphocytidyl-2-C-methyl-D-erythritol kinase
MDLDLPFCRNAPAKINLFLHVLGRFPNGYHRLQSLFMRVDLADEITLSRREDGHIRRPEGAIGVPEADDLVVRAAQALKAHVQSPWGADITVKKRIPMGAGLGGGSSDAASVLVGLNRLWGCGLSLPALARLGLGLGADVPFFVSGHPAAWVEGVGESIRPVTLPMKNAVLVWPGISVPTACVFQAPDLCRDTPEMALSGVGGDLETVDIEKLMARSRNDLQPVACRLYPPIGEALAWLSGFGPARMTGSGSTVFLPVGGPDHARAIAQACPHPDWKAFDVVLGG